MSDTLYMHSIESLGALDGPGLRTVIFLSGCPLRCQYCHNPDTWHLTDGQPTDIELLFQRIMKLKPYYQDKGGVTFSGGEPLLQAAALIPLIQKLKSEGIHTAIDTSGALWNEEISKLIALSDLIILDVKHTNPIEYHNLTSGHLEDNLLFLKSVIHHKTPYWIRQVIVPGINDTQQQLIDLEGYSHSNYREKIELLPFHKHGIHKWRDLNLNFPFEGLEAMTESQLKKLAEETELPFDIFSI